ncbi:hypothetical protein D9757_014216 [Collybiopsis confluens]|uniref:Uncharacterized protein n=1 Tax=Collybiopsis confluens TaxID=2823264 RepID=A0A8H5FUC9_9AGAR|nr:hypothetical protein D9757_014216 [Collybiopsis confluens]
MPGGYSRPSDNASIFEFGSPMSIDPSWNSLISSASTAGVYRSQSTTIASAWGAVDFQWPDILPAAASIFDCVACRTWNQCQTSSSTSSASLCKLGRGRFNGIRLCLAIHQPHDFRGSGSPALDPYSSRGQRRSMLGSQHIRFDDLASLCRRRAPSSRAIPLKIVLSPFTPNSQFGELAHINFACPVRRLLILTGRNSATGGWISGLGRRLLVEFILLCRLSL